MKSDLHEYLADQQSAAQRVQGLLDGLLVLMGDHQQSTATAQYAIASMAYELAGDLNNNLDSVNLPEGGAA